MGGGARRPWGLWGRAFGLRPVRHRVLWCRRVRVPFFSVHVHVMFMFMFTCAYFSPSRQQDAVFLFFSCFPFLFPPSNITCFLFCVCSLIEKPTAPYLGTYGLGKVRTTSGSDNTTRRTERRITEQERWVESGSVRLGVWGRGAL